MAQVVDGVAQSAQTAVGNGTEVDCTGCSAIAVVITGNGTTSGGSYLIESSDVAGYTGTWVPTQGQTLASAVSGDKKVRTTFTGPVHFVRVRIDAIITGGGTLTARIIGI